MEIIKVTPRGYCKGVVRAIELAKQAALNYPNQTIYILGMLVHNKYVVEALSHYGIKTLPNSNKSKEELLDSIEEGVVIFTAHGIHPSIKQKAIDKGLTVIDATCPDVLTTTTLVSEHIKQGYHILYIGKKGHPEASAVCDFNKNITLIQNEDDIHRLPNYDKLFVTNQTTMSIYDIETLFNRIKNKFPQAVFAEEICNATRIRQEAIAKLTNVDVLVIVGDRASNNSNRLAQIGKEHGIKRVYLIDDANDLLQVSLKEADRIAVSSGASTPTYLTNQVIDFLQNNKQQPQVIEINKIL